MTDLDFLKTKSDFLDADVDGKIALYVNARGLNSDQYMELLRLFPLEKLSLLETALG